MKLTSSFFLAAQLAGLAASQSVSTQNNLTAPFAYNLFSATSEGSKLEGDAALAFLFNYDPSVPHTSDYPNLRSWGGEALPPSDRYDTGYISRVCLPAAWSGKGMEIEWELDQCEGLEGDECGDLSLTYEYNLQSARAQWAGSEYPCERIQWIETECGINVGGFRGHGVNETKHSGTAAQQNQCLCDGDYFAAQAACYDCYALHTGNETQKSLDAKYLSVHSEVMCKEAATATKSMWEYASSAWESVYTPYAYSEGSNTTIVSDGAQNKTDVSLYMTEAIDFVPATVREPAFTRTVGGKEAVMTPGVLMANAKEQLKPNSGVATATAGSAAAEATAEEGGARSVRVQGGLVVVALGALLML